MGEINGMSVTSLVLIFPPTWLLGYVLARLNYERFQPEREKRSQIIRSALAGVALYVLTILILITGPSPDDPNFGGRNGQRIDQGPQQTLLTRTRVGS